MGANGVRIFTGITTLPFRLSQKLFPPVQSPQEFDLEYIKRLQRYYPGLNAEVRNLLSHIRYQTPGISVKLRIIDVIDIYRIKRIALLRAEQKQIRRAAYPASKRIQCMQGLLFHVFSNLQATKQIETTIKIEQLKILHALNISITDTFPRYFEDCKGKINILKQHDVTLNDLKEHIRMQIRYSLNQRDRMMEIYQAAEKYLLNVPKLKIYKSDFTRALEVIYFDEIFQNRPQLDREDYLECSLCRQLKNDENLVELRKAISDVRSRASKVQLG